MREANTLRKLKQTKQKVIFDRIEAGTYLVAAAATEGNLKIKNVIPKIIQTEINILRKIGSKITTKKDVQIPREGVEV